MFCCISLELYLYHMWWECVRGLGAVLQGHKNWVQIVSWSPDAAMLASGDQNGVIWLWQPKAGETIGACRGGLCTACQHTPLRTHQTHFVEPLFFWYLGLYFNWRVLQHCPMYT